MNALYFVAVAAFLQFATSQILYRNPAPTIQQPGTNFFGQGLANNAFSNKNFASGVPNNVAAVATGLPNNVATVATALPNSLANLGNTATFTIGNNGNPFTLTTGSAGPPAYGLQIFAEALEVGGNVAVTGQMPIYGAVTINGAVPTDGTASANYGCGQPNEVGIY